MAMKVIITGSTGMVGEGVLLECLNSEKVSNILLINRRPSLYKDPKIDEVILTDFMNIKNIQDRIKNFDACYFCSGISSVGINSDTYKKITYDLTLTFAQVVLTNSPNLTFCYVSGEGTDSAETSRLEWARIKGRTENELLQLGFKDAYMFRPGLLKAHPHAKYTLKYYRYLKPLVPLALKLFPKHCGTLAELGKAMINATTQGFNKKVLNVLDIREISKL